VRILKFAGNFAPMSKTKNASKVLIGELQERNWMEDQGVHDKIILKLNLYIRDVGMGIVLCFGRLSNSQLLKKDSAPWS
jgi:hypothetical protein